MWRYINATFHHQHLTDYFQKITTDRWKDKELEDLGQAWEVHVRRDDERQKQMAKIVLFTFKQASGAQRGWNHKGAGGKQSVRWLEQEAGEVTEKRGLNVLSAEKQDIKGEGTQNRKVKNLMMFEGDDQEIQGLLHYSNGSYLESLINLEVGSHKKNLCFS